jgi:hypothetical protein
MQDGRTLPAEIMVEASEATGKDREQPILQDGLRIAGLKD